jgi:hypothetical protein
VSPDAENNAALTEPDRRLLAKVVDAWPHLSGALKLAVLAIVDASGK